MGGFLQLLEITASVGGVLCVCWLMAVHVTYAD